MFEALLGSKFSKKCKYWVKCISSRLQLIRKKRQATVRFLKKDVADLLANGHELNAFGRIEALIVEINRTSCYDMIEQYCQCILNQLPSIQKQRECPEEAMEAVSTLIFAAARFSDLPELYNLRQVFTERYESHIESSVNAEFVEKVQKKSFPTDKKLRLMQNIAEEFSVSWDSWAFRQKLSNPSAPPSHQPKRGISNTEGRSHGEMSGRNAAGNGRKEAVIIHAAAVNGRAGAGLDAGGLVNVRKEAVINSVAAGGSFNVRKEAVSGAGEDREIASKERREPPSWTFVQKQLVQPEPRDMHVIPVVCSGRSHNPAVPVNSKDARPFNMIPPPYTKPRFGNPSTPADDTKLTDVPIKSSHTADHERSDDGDKAKPVVSVRRRLPKPTLVTGSDSATDDAKPNGRHAGDGFYAEKNLDGNQRKTAAGEMNGAVNDERHGHGRRKHVGRRSTATYDGDRDEEEAAMDRLLLHFSKKGMNNDASRRRARPRAPPELVDAGRVRTQGSP